MFVNMPVRLSRRQGMMPATQPGIFACDLKDSTQALRDHLGNWGWVLMAVNNDQSEALRFNEANCHLFQ